MREILDAFEEVNLDNFEYCTLVEDAHHASQSFPMYVPKLMAGIPIAPKASWKESVSSCYVNSKDECGISFESKVVLQNYLTIVRHFDTNFEYRSEESGIINKGVRFIIHTMNGDPKDLKVDKVV